MSDLQDDIFTLVFKHSGESIIEPTTKPRFHCLNTRERGDVCGVFQFPGG